MVYIVKWIELTGTSPLFHTPVKVFQHDWEGYTVYQLRYQTNYVSLTFCQSIGSDNH